MNRGQNPPAQVRTRVVSVGRRWGGSSGSGQTPGSKARLINTKKICRNVFITSSSELSPISFQASNHLQGDESITNQKCHIALEHAQEVEVASLYVRIIGFDGFVRPLLQF